MTQEFVRYIDTPKPERKKKVKEPIAYQCFGFIPLSIIMHFTFIRKRTTMLWQFTYGRVRHRINSYLNGNSSHRR